MTKNNAVWREEDQTASSDSTRACTVDELEQRVYTAWQRLGDAEQRGESARECERLYDRYVEALNCYIIERGKANGSHVSE